MKMVVRGISTSDGIAIGPVWIFNPDEITVTRIENCNPTEQWNRIEKALKKSFDQLGTLHQHTLETIGAGEAEIFEAHQLILSDPDLLTSLKEILENKRVNAEVAIQEAIEKYAVTLQNLDTEYFKARAQDIRDVGRRIIKNLLEEQPAEMSFNTSPAIILANDLAPSDTVQFNRKNILGFCIVRGGPTSHTAILARSIGVPAVVSAPMDLNQVSTGTIAILNGSEGTLVIDPSPEELATAQKAQSQQNADFKKILDSAFEPAVTLDGVRVNVVANIGGAKDAVQAVENGAEGVGLLRTEFLYLERDAMPSEEEQLATYRKIFETMGNRPVIVRTMDIGGDKQVSYLGIKTEPNPFLGWRAIRMISERPEVLRDQFRVILQAGVGHDIRIMIPMVSCVDEVLQAKELYMQARRELQSEGKICTEHVEFGIMVEVPAAALLVKTMANYVDFFSIGTNDLTQYVTAVDRTNERVVHLASYFHPAVLQLIAKIIKDAHSKQKMVGLCGEMAGNPLALPFLLGAGLDEFSMAARSIPVIKQKVRTLSAQACAKVVDEILELTTTSAVEKYLKELAQPA